MSETVYLRNNFAKLEKAKETSQNTVPKIQKVASYLRDREHSKKHYLPRLVSIGLIDHGKRKLELGEKYKLMWTAKYLERTKQDGQTLYQKIASNIKQLKEHFAEDVIKDFDGDDEKLSWTLFVDGCSLLQILEKANPYDPKEMNVKVDQLLLVWQDVLLLENQLPYEVLLLLSGHQNDDTLLKSMNKFLEYHHLTPKQTENTHATNKSKKNEDRNRRKKDSLSQKHIIDIIRKEPPFHLLDQFRRCIVGDKIDIRKESPFHLLDQLRRYIVGDAQKEPQDQKGDAENGERDGKKNKDLDTTYRNIEDLRAAGIKLKVEESRELKAISFRYRWMRLRAELTLPKIIVDDTIATSFHNLVAYEMCPDFENNFEISSFVTFMDSLIDHPEDVKELRLAEVLCNELGSDEEVAKLFNTISADLVPNCGIYSSVRGQIGRYCKKKYMTW
ncbi:uncharacterized protein LOC128193341 isoform X2 [Vigna angularis]|nr:uncharacterized protein LOC128193341 isoform X2 [Vigna angularis]